MRQMIPYKLDKAVSEHPRILAARGICETLKKAGWQAWWVGGCVRDFLLNPTFVPQDIDIATDASFNSVRKILPGTLAIGKAFGVGLTSIGEHSFEIATFRKESDYVDRRHPSKVGPGTIEEDSSRRDFTVNALYFDPIDDVIVDFHEGMSDLNSRQLRCVGDAITRLHEDPLRILRLYRFAANLNFEIEETTRQAAQSLTGELIHISLERVLLEISKLKTLAIDSFTKNVKSAQPVLLRDSHPNSKSLREGDTSNQLKAPKLVVPDLALRHPGSLFALMCIHNEGFESRDWQLAFKSWPLSLEERAHIDLIVRCASKKFHIPPSNGSDPRSSLWREWLENCRWLLRQNRIEVVAASWLTDNIPLTRIEEIDILRGFCRVCSQENSQLGFGTAVEKTISADAKPMRTILQDWATDKPPEALGWARLFVDISLLMNLIGIDNINRPAYLRLSEGSNLAETCSAALQWSLNSQSQSRKRKAHSE